jgi:hypothetical protein
MMPSRHLFPASNTPEHSDTHHRPVFTIVSNFNIVGTPGVPRRSNQSRWRGGVLASWDCSDQIHADGVWERIDVALGRVRGIAHAQPFARPRAPGAAFATASFRANDISP